MDTSKKENKEIEMPDLGEQCSAHGPAEEEVCRGEAAFGGGLAFNHGLLVFTATSEI